MTDPLTPQPAPTPAAGDVWLDLIDAVEVPDRLRLLSTPASPRSTPPLPHEWPADPRDPLVCVHGCGGEPGDVLIEDECPRRLRAALEESAGEWDRLRVAARAVVAAWDRPNAMPAFGAAIAGLRAALAGRGVTPIDHALAQHVVIFEYVNHAGKDSTRHVVLTAKSLRFEQELPYYPEPEWLMDGFDLDKRAKRTFALCKMRNVRRA